MACIEKLECPDCGKENMQTFLNEADNSYSAYCFTCMELKDRPYQDGVLPEVHVKTPDEIFAELQEVRECNYLDAKTRGIPGDFIKKWGVKKLLSQFDGKTPYAAGFPYSKDGKLASYKIIPFKPNKKGKKGCYAVGDLTDADPFGFERAMKIGGRLYITEGEWDCIALDYCLTLANKGGKYYNMKHAVISLPAGGGSMDKVLTKERWSKLTKRFTEFVLVLDNDDVGKKAEKVALKLYPKFLLCEKPHGCKDANEALINGMALQMAKMARWEACKPVIEGVVHVRDVIARGLEKPVMGLSYGMRELDEMTFGQRFKECCAVGGGTGSGKTLLSHMWAAQNINVHGLPVFEVLLEEENHNTLRNIAGKIDGITYHNPKTDYDEDQFMATVESLQGKLFMWESGGNQHLRFDLDEIIQAIRFNVAEYGVKFVDIDNMTRLVDHLRSSEANEFINKYASELEGLAVELDIHIRVFSHLNAPQYGFSHEEGGAIVPNQFTGSKGMMRSFPLMMGFERNKFAPDGRACYSWTTVIKNRKFGNEGKVKTQYYPNTGLLKENNWETENGQIWIPKKKGEF